MTTASPLDRVFKISVASLAIIGVLAVLLFVAHYLHEIVILCGMTFLFTYILLSPVNILEAWLHRGVMAASHALHIPRPHNRWLLLMPRGVAILMVYLVFGVSMLVASVRFFPVAFDELYQFSHDLPKYIHEGEEWLLNQPWTQGYFHQEARLIESQADKHPAAQKSPLIHITSEPSHVAEAQKSVDPAAKLSPREKKVIREKVFLTSERVNHFVSEHLTKALNNLMTIISTTVAGFIYALTGVILVFYFLLDGAKLKEGLIHMLPPDAQGPVDHFLTSLHSVMFGYVKGHVILGIVTWIYLMIINSIAGIHYGFFLALFFAVMQIIPVVGPWLGLLPWLLVIHLVTPGQFFLAMGGLLLFQLIKDVWIYPKVFGHVLGLHPVIVILSLLICAKVAGVIGLLFAIPLASMINVFIQYAQEKDRHRFSDSH